MSLLTEAYAVPSVVRGVVRHVLHSRSQRASLDSLMTFLAPDAVETHTRQLSTAGRVLTSESDAEAKKTTGKDRVRKTLNECLRMGLLTQEGEEITLAPCLPEEFRNPLTEDSWIPSAICGLIFDPSNESNHDLGLAIAWYLSLDAVAPPGTWPEVEKLLLDTGMKETLKLGDVRYHMLEDWLCYLGFGWTHVPSGRKLVPDPTAYIRRSLGGLFPSTLPDRQPLPAVMARLADACPVFEGGSLRSRVDAASDGATRLSTATALAWMRLRDEGAVVLHHESDGQTLMLPDGDQAQPVSHVTVVRRREV